MPSILDSSPYPWPLKEAQDLHRLLCKLHPSQKQTTLAAEQSGVDLFLINVEQPIYIVWYDLLNLAANNGLTRKLVGDVYNRTLPTNPDRPFLEAFLANKPVAVSAQPFGAMGAPIFISGTDQIFDHEALLFRDDLTLAAGKIPALIKTLETLLSLSPAVCKLTVDVEGAGQYGTGFRIGKDILLTNWHVFHNINNGRKATAVSAEFGYEDDGKGGVLAPRVIKCDVSTIVTDKANDWGIIRTTDALDPAWPVIKLSEAVAPTTAGAAYIIQHPGGNRKRFGFIRNQVSDFTDTVVHYLTDTEGGSSGSPVFDEQGKIFALHHAGGRPQEVLGRPPMNKNEGINIAKVVEGLTANNIAFD